MIDSHVHIDFEKIESELENYIKKAEELNIEELTVTNHIVLPNVPSPDFVIRDKKVFLKDMSFLKCSLVTPDIKRYVTAIKKKESSGVYVGAEIDYNKKHEDKIREFIAMHPFDLVLGSLHSLDGYHISRKQGMKSFTDKVPTIEIYKRYFTELRSLAKSKLFDVVSHLDIVRKHSEQIDFIEYESEATRLVQDLLENDVGIEVNTCGYAFIDDSYPSLEFLLICKEKGLDKITIGSDAHIVEKLGENLEKAIEKLKFVGYKKIVKFKNRQPQYIDL